MGQPGIESTVQAAKKLKERLQSAEKKLGERRDARKEVVGPEYSSFFQYLVGKGGEKGEWRKGYTGRRVSPSSS